MDDLGFCFSIQIIPQSLWFKPPINFSMGAFAILHGKWWQHVAWEEQYGSKDIIALHSHPEPIQPPRHVYIHPIYIPQASLHLYTSPISCYRQKVRIWTNLYTKMKWQLIVCLKFAAYTCIKTTWELVMAKSGPEPWFKPEPLRTWPKSGSKFEEGVEPNHLSGLRFDSRDNLPNPFKQVQTGLNLDKIMQRFYDKSVLTDILYITTC